jgi:hypothetical protein
MARGVLAKSTVGTCALTLLALAGASSAQSSREAPLVLEFQQGIKAELVSLTFMKEVTDGTRRMRVPDDKVAKFRLAVATIKITKPAGTQFTLACADLTLHYYHAAETEVTPCEGMSSFTSSLDSDREVSLSTTNGPGFLKKTTATRSTEAAVVYVDALFGSMEPDTREAWIAVGQVSDRNRPFISKGWQP